VEAHCVASSNDITTEDAFGKMSQVVRNDKARNNDDTRLSIQQILKQPIGSLDHQSITTLCNSVRFVPNANCQSKKYQTPNVNSKGSSLWCLKVLERILSEIIFWEEAKKSDRQTSSNHQTIYLKSIHVFSVLTTLSHDIRNHKNHRKKLNYWQKNQISRSDQKLMNASDIQCLKNVVCALYQLHNNRNGKDGPTWEGSCFSQDVPSFATMIAAEASKTEKSGVDAAFYFLDIMNRMTRDAGRKVEEEDPRLIGAVLNGLAQWGRAEEAQILLGRTLGVEISMANKKLSAIQSLDHDVTCPRKLTQSQAGPCYDAVLRAWSKCALLTQQQIQPNTIKFDEQSDKSVKKRLAPVDAMSQALHILLTQMPPEQISNRSCSAVLQGYGALGMGKEAEDALLKIEWMLKSPLEEGPIASSSLDVACYNSILHGYCKASKREDMHSAVKLFQAMKTETPIEINTGSSFFVIPPMPDIISYASLLNCYGKLGMASEAEKLINSMMSVGTTTRKPLETDPPEPTIACYISTMQAFENSFDRDAPARALALLQRLESIGQDSENKRDKRSRRSNRMPNRIIYNYALRCMSKHGRGEEAEKILNMFNKAHPNCNGPDIYAYALALRAWERVGKINPKMAAERAEKLFIEMKNLSSEGYLPPLELSSYNTLLGIFARAGLAYKAECLLHELEVSKSSEWNQVESFRAPEPNQMSYNLVIKAISRSNEKNSVTVERAWNILYRLGYPKKGDTSRTPMQLSIDTLNSMLKLLSKRGLAAEAESLLNAMDDFIVEGRLKRNIAALLSSYEATLEALGRCKTIDAAKRAEELVTRMEVVGELGGEFQPSLLAYNTLLNCYANAGMAGKSEALLERINQMHEAGRIPSPPDIVSFGSTIKAIANSGKSQENAVARAEALAKSVGHGNEVIYALRLKLLAKWGLGEEAERLLAKMKEEYGFGNLKNGPSVIHYTCVLNAWAKSDDENAVSRAEALFRSMTENNEIDLDLAAYHGMMLNYSLRGQVEKAETFLFDDIMATHKPNRNSFTMLIDAYARCSSKDVGEKAMKTLNKMRELHAAGNKELAPDDVTYASVIRCKMKNGKLSSIRDMTEFEKFLMMRELQIESWPFRHQESYLEASVVDRTK